MDLKTRICSKRRNVTLSYLSFDETIHCLGPDCDCIKLLSSPHDNTAAGHEIAGAMLGDSLIYSTYTIGQNNFSIRGHF